MKKRNRNYIKIGNLIIISVENLNREKSQEYVNAIAQCDDTIKELKREHQIVLEDKTRAFKKHNINLSKQLENSKKECELLKKQNKQLANQYEVSMLENDSLKKSIIGYKSSSTKYKKRITQLSDELTHSYKLIKLPADRTQDHHEMKVKSSTKKSHIARKFH